jgi:putative SOS response-associated peptidase YedK
MCGRFASEMTWEQLYVVLGGTIHGDASHLTARFNIAPTQTIPAIIRVNDDFRLGPMHWGVKPDWADSNIINAQGEKYLKPGRSWWASFRRCAIPATGFYEWRRSDNSKEPMYIRVTDGEPFLFAGLYQMEKDASGMPPGRSVIVTTQPNDVVKPIHNRMPAILLPEHVATWLDPATDREDLRSVLEPYPADRMETWQVSRKVNSVANTDSELMTPVS